MFEVLVSSVNRLQQTSKAEVFDAYRQLLRKADSVGKLSAGDTSRLAEVAAELGKGGHDASADLAILRQERELAAKATELDGIKRECMAAAEACRLHGEKMEREIGALKMEANRLGEISSNLERRQLGLLNVPNELARLRADNRRLLGIMLERKPALLIHTIPAIQTVNGANVFTYVPAPNYHPQPDHEIVSFHSELEFGTVDLGIYRFVRCDGQSEAEFESWRQSLTKAYESAPDIAPEFV